MAPSSNVGCEYRKRGVECAILERSWKVQPTKAQIKRYDLVRSSDGSWDGRLAGHFDDGFFELTDSGVVRVDRFAGDPSEVVFGLSNKGNADSVLFRRYRLQTVGYDKAVAVNDRVACVVQKIGLSCWDVETQHGFLLSRASYLRW